MNQTPSLSASTSPIAAPVLGMEQANLVEKNLQLEQLLASLHEASPKSEERRFIESPDVKFENQLAMVRLGIASSLFFSLRAKHVATAAHSLRVALSCSAWAHRLGLDQSLRDRIEVASLLHDLGKIGIPDRVLRKPGKLTVDEQLTMDCCSRLGVEILRGCTSDNELLDIVLHANSWYDGRRHDDGPRGDALPVGARMLAIADAFDAMTTDHVYRSALSRERAIQELAKGSDTQFDPELVIDFSNMLEDRPELLQGVVLDRWLNQLQSDSELSIWNSGSGHKQAGFAIRSGQDELFLDSLVGKLKDGVVFTDSEGTITRWNDTMQHLTGISCDAIHGKAWSNETVRLRENDSSRQEDSCIVTQCLRSASSFQRKMVIEQPGGISTPVHVQVTPVSGSQPGCLGTVIVIRDVSDEANMLEKLDSLHQQVTRDPLTGIANRAYFDEQLALLTARAKEGGSTFSLIICDIDHFKRVNDVHGHPAGDEALIRFAEILESHSRDGDLVARYGGEEFLLIANNCDNATTTKRAEVIRAALERTPLPSIGNEAVTASFGVTEYQAGDTAETILARSDRALLKAKDNGRNRVIQLGSGNRPSETAESTKRGWFAWFDVSEIQKNSEFDILTPVPTALVIEKLRGFIADHDAEVMHVTENQVSIKVNAVCTTGGRRRVDHQIVLNAQLTLSEQKRNDFAGSGSRHWDGTKVHVAIRPIRNRDRRNRALKPCIVQLVSSLKSYLMGEIVTDSDV
ncbi:diguanylate cyclase domain-containing protein [Novipirellula sp. SH528]|uniref:sensor domain-containing diguanylate cyclase/phosphohydrolase n=1 Tax=Novipirellula sp. SH528 TaxID=3454466 RepID=UPI003F9FC06C